MRIAIIVEGKTEIVFRQHLRSFLETKLAGKMPVLDFVPYHGRIPTGEKLRRVVENLLGDEKRPADAVIALTDVYTGSQPPDFRNGADAKEKMKNWVGPRNEKFHPHASQHDFEAWLLPYWEKIKIPEYSEELIRAAYLAVDVRAAVTTADTVAVEDGLDFPSRMCTAHRPTDGWQKKAEKESAESSPSFTSRTMSDETRSAATCGDMSRRPALSGWGDVALSHLVKAVQRRLRSEFTRIARSDLATN